MLGYISCVWKATKVVSNAIVTYCNIVIALVSCPGFVPFIAVDVGRAVAWR